MWVPVQTSEIEDAIARGDLQETATFDAKRELPTDPKHNPLMATDVAAMSTDGGVLLIGVGEDADKRLTISNPVPLANARERVDAIIGSSISEVPYVEVKAYSLADDPTMGYLAIVVPPSPRAPHQVIVGGDLRFYGRGATGNRKLTEGEIARLYERRQRQQVDLDDRLTEVVRHARFQPVPNLGYVYAFAQPVPPSAALWDAATADAGDQALLSRLADAARRPAVRGGHDPNFQSGTTWGREGADAMRLSSTYPPKADETEAPFYAEVTLNIDGRGVLFSGHVARRVSEQVGVPDEDGRKYIFEPVVAANVAAFFALMCEFFASASYFGAVDCGLVVTGLDEGYSTGRVPENAPFVFWSEFPQFNSDRYSRTQRLASASELSDAEGIALDLLARLFEATTGRPDYNSFETAT